MKFIILIILIVLGAIPLIIYIITDTVAHEIDKNKCLEISSCERYKCLANTWMPDTIYSRENLDLYYSCKLVYDKEQGK